MVSLTRQRTASQEQREKHDFQHFKYIVGLAVTVPSRYSYDACHSSVWLAPFSFFSCLQTFHVDGCASFAFSNECNHIPNLYICMVEFKLKRNSFVASYSVRFPRELSIMLHLRFDRYYVSRFDF